MEQGQFEEQTTLRIVLTCTSQDTTEEKLLVLREYPRTVLDIKKVIETKCNIPASIQQLKHESTLLQDTNEVDRLHIRSGDTLHLTYKSRAQCDEIQEAVSWMDKLYNQLQDGSLPSTSDEAHDLIYQGIHASIMEDLAFQKFSPWIDPSTHVNKVYFLQIGGLDVLLKLYSLTLQQPWSAIPPEVKYVEFACMTVLSNLASSLELRRVILQRGVLAMCLQSLVRVRLTKGEPVVDQRSTQREQHLNDALLQDAVRSAVAIIANVCELPETHAQIVSNPNVLHQLICMSHSPSYEVLISQLVASVFLCLAHSPAVHCHLAQPGIIRDLLAVWDVRRGQGAGQGAEEMDILLLKYFTQMFLTQLALHSPDLLPFEMLETLIEHMEKFLHSTTPLQIMQYEEKQRFSWSVFLPYVSLAYIPNIPTYPENMVLTKLQLLSLETVMFWLRSTLGRSNHQELLIEEGLLDYVTCIPWCVPESIKVSSNALVSTIAAGSCVTPPRLSTIAKSKLAVMYFGLKQVLKVHSAHELLQIDV